MSRKDIIRRYMEFIREASQQKAPFRAKEMVRAHGVSANAQVATKELGWVIATVGQGTKWVGPIPHDEKELRSMAIKLMSRTSKKNMAAQEKSAQHARPTTPIAPEKPAQAELPVTSPVPEKVWLRTEPSQQPQAPAVGDGALKPRKRELNLLWGLFKINW